MKNLNLKETFEVFNKHNILIIGDVMVDSYMWGNVERISPEAPVPIVSSTRQEFRLGGAANVALNIQSLGAKPILCSVIGNDSKKSIFLELLKTSGLSGNGIIFDDNRVTTMKTRIISSNQHLLRIDEENSHYLDEKTESLLINKVREIILKGSIHAIIFQDYDKGVITQPVINQLISFAIERGIPTLVDPKKRNFTAYKNVTLFKPNFKELTEGLNIHVSRKDNDGVFKAAQKLYDTIHAELIMITLSEAGMFISDNSTYHIIPAYVRDIADVSGAGDTVISTASLCLASGMKMYDIAAISNMAGGIVCEKSGVVPIDKDKLLKECENLKKQMNSF